MNLVAAVSILLVTILAFQTTVINGAKSLAEHKPGGGLSVEAAPPAGGEVLIRSGRGAKSSNQGTELPAGTGKRGKNSKKLNKNAHLESPTGASADVGRQAPQEKHQQGPASGSGVQHQQQQHAKPKQRQMLRSQQHQTHVKRGGGSAKATAEKKSDDQKQASCRYAKSAWSECDTKTNSRSRTLTLKKGEASCLQSRTIQKKCKKACRYEKGAWTECTAGQMTRQDKLKTTSDTTCEAVRSINKKCNPAGKPKDKGNKDRKNKEKGARKAQAAAA